MGVMTKFRESTGVVLWILVIAFGVIFMLQDTQVFDVIGNAPDSIAEVNGDEILISQFDQAVDAEMQAYQQRTGESMPPQQADDARDRVFNQLVDNRLREQEMERLGIDVTDDELYDLVLGQEPDPIILAYFSDGQGGVDRQLLQNFIDSPEQEQQLVQIEDYLRRKRRQEKLDALIMASVRVSDADVMEAYMRQNKTLDTRYVGLVYSRVPDDSISVTERDIERFYKDNRDDFEQKATYTLQYVTVSKRASQQDTALVLNELMALRQPFITAANDSLFLARNLSERPYTSAFFRRDELDDAVAEGVFSNPEQGRIVGPIMTNGEARMVKITGVRDAEEPVVRARHILVRAPEGDAAARAAARQTIADARNRIRGGASFAEVAAEVSQDGSSQNGGDLGYFGPGRMVEPFEDAAFGARVGQLVGPVETQFGVHLIEVTERADTEVQLADLSQRIEASISTLNAGQEMLGDLQYYASEGADFAEEAASNGLTPQTLTVDADARFFPGLGQSRGLRTFAERADEGDVSEVIELNDVFIVAKLTEKTEEGYRPLEEVRPQVEAQAKRAAKMRVQMDRMRAAYAAGDLDATASALGQNIRPANGLSFTSIVVPGLGREPLYVGTAFGLDEGETSGIVEGENAVFMVQTTQVNEPTPITEADKTRLRDQLLRQRQQQVQQQWISDLRDQADVEDRRILLQR